MPELMVGGAGQRQERGPDARNLSNERPQDTFLTYQPPPTLGAVGGGWE